MDQVGFISYLYTNISYIWHGVIQCSCCEPHYCGDSCHDPSYSRLICSRAKTWGLEILGMSNRDKKEKLRHRVVLRGQLKGYWILSFEFWIFNFPCTFISQHKMGDSERIKGILEAWWRILIISTQSIPKLKLCSILCSF